MVGVSLGVGRPENSRPQPYAESEILQTFQQVESSGWGVGHFGHF